jgi:hypothetical protein
VKRPSDTFDTERSWTTMTPTPKRRPEWLERSWRCRRVKPSELTDNDALAWIEDSREHTTEWRALPGEHGRLYAWRMRPDLCEVG